VAAPGAREALGRHAVQKRLSDLGLSVDAERMVAVYRALMDIAGEPKIIFARTALITSALFSVMHVYPVLFPVAFIVGLGAAWVRERTGS